MQISAWRKSQNQHSFRFSKFKILVVMKLITIFIIVACLQVSATGLGQRITLSEKNAALSDVVNSIQRQSGYQFFYRGDQLAKVRVSIRVKDATVADALNQLLKGLPFTYTITDKIIVIKEREVTNDAKMNTPVSPPLTHDVTVHVTDSTGQPLAGASVYVKGTKKGGSTDAQGNVTLSEITGNETLVISYVGYETKEMHIGSDRFANIVLKKSNNPLDQIQIIAYGTTTRRFQTGNITTINSEDIEKQPVTNPLLALEGRVPGLQITQATGFAGSGVNVMIQGLNSIAKGNDPFYVIDGVPYNSELLPNRGGVLGANGGGGFGSSFGNPLSFINPADIESIEVLKDADATSIYGSRAANGAILITTKKGKAGKMKVDLNMRSGWSDVNRRMQLLNLRQYLDLRYEGFKNDNAVPGPGDYDLMVWDTTRSTDWQKTLLGGTAKYTDANADISGGNDNIQYLIGAGYHKETSIFPGSYNDQKGSLHFNVNNLTAKQRLTFQLSGSYLADNNTLPTVDLTQTAINLPPDAPDLYNADGTLNWAPSVTGSSTWTNPLSYLYDHYNAKTNNLVSNLLLSYRILPGLDIKSSFGYTNMQMKEVITVPLISKPPENRPTSQATAQFENNNSNSWLIEPQISYHKSVLGGDLEALIGSTIQQNNSDGIWLLASGYNSDLVLKDIKSASKVSVSTTINNTYKYNALFGRINYRLQNKYLFNLTARRDGSSRFGSQNQFHNFGAAGIGWIFSEEKYVKQNIGFLSFGKLRASYGTTGSDQIGEYQFLNLYSPYGVGNPYQGATGLYPTGLSNPYLAWEETRKFSLGTDLGFYQDRIYLTVDYFRNRSSNQLVGAPLPIVTGFNSITENLPAIIQNTGVEISIQGKNIRTKNFSWSTNFNITIPQNKLVAFPDLATSSYASYYRIGKPLQGAILYHSLGVDPETGLYQFLGSDGRATSNPDGQTDKTVFLNRTQKYYGGLENEFQYKGLSLSFLFQFVKQIGPSPILYPGAANDNFPIMALKRWQKPGDITTIQKANTNYSIVTQYFDWGQSDASFEDASFIRLKNVAISYQLPKAWIRRLSLTRVSIFGEGQNLLTFTKYTGLDPESQSSTTLPPLRTFTFGLSVGL